MQTPPDLQSSSDGNQKDALRKYLTENFLSKFTDKRTQSPADATSNFLEREDFYRD